MGKVEITVVEARSLRNKQLIGIPDPFVRIACRDKKYKTATAKNTINPEWKETFRFQIADESSTQIQLEVWNKGVVNDDLMGYYDLSLAGLTKGVVKDEWYILENSKTLAELRVRVLAVDFGAKPAPEDEWKVTMDINNDPVAQASEKGANHSDKKTPPADVSPASTKLSSEKSITAPSAPSAPVPSQYSQPQVAQPSPGQYMPPNQPAPYAAPSAPYPQMPQPPPSQFVPPPQSLPYPLQPLDPRLQVPQPSPGQYMPPYQPAPYAAPSAPYPQMPQPPPSQFVPPPQSLPYPLQPLDPRLQVPQPSPGQYMPPYQPAPYAAPSAPYPQSMAYAGTSAPVGQQPTYGFYNMPQPPMHPSQPGFRY